jgi:ATPase related to the helicase subunit of the Holliday junction resolvase
MRPRNLDEYVGQEHIIGEGKMLRRAIMADRLGSLIFCGPTGSGKTALAEVIAQTTSSTFVRLNAVTAGVSQIREVVEQARDQLGMYGKRTILFVDEIHRFNKSQQDALLPYVEDGLLTLIGATTENPYVEVNKALISRSTIYRLEPLGPDQIRLVLARALEDARRGYGSLQVEVIPEAMEHLVFAADGDARRALNALELAVLTTSPGEDGVIRIGPVEAAESIRQKVLTYDKNGDQHYDVVSAFIKSMRASRPDAALHYMVRMLESGEDPRFVSRRMMIFASEDIGLADPAALTQPRQRTTP